MKTGKLGCIVQARTTSSRLPNKVLKTLDFQRGTSILEQIISHLKEVKGLDSIIIATTINRTDDKIETVAAKTGVECFRGSESDVLERYDQAATEFGLDTIIRITSDCPFIDPGVINDLIASYKENEFDYVSNGQNRTYPHGLDCEIFSFAALERAYIEGKDDFFREHVTTYIYSHPENFKIGSLELEEENYSHIRITVDTKEDYILACILYDYLKERNNFSFQEIVSIFQEKPFLRWVNEGSLQKKKYESYAEELETALEIMRLQEMPYTCEIIEDKLQVLKRGQA